MTQNFSWDLFHSLPVVGILRGAATSHIRPLVDAVRAGGLTNLEITMNAADAAAQIRAARAAAGDELNIGAGTVTTSEELARALDAGASYIVTPVVVDEVIAGCRDRGVPVFAGALTPTEVFRAWRAGADMVKLFPAGRLGPGYLRDLKAPLSQVRILAVGGITAELLPEYAAAGADGFGVGGALFRQDRLAAADWPGIRAAARRFRQACTASRSRRDKAVPPRAGSC